MADRPSVRVPRMIASSALLVVMLMMIIWGCGDDDADACSTFCKELGDCHYLPSSLGGGASPVANCTDRCERSAGGTSAELARDRCLKVDAAACDLLGTCLDTNLPGTGARGVGEATVAFRVDMPSGIEQGPFTASDTFCQRLGHAEITLTSANLPTSNILRVSCEEALGEGFTQIQLPAGQYSPVVKIVVSQAANGCDIKLPDGGDARGVSATACVLRKADPGTLPAGGSHVFDVHLPSMPCELLVSDPTTACETDCTNGIDDDRDGLVDCADPACRGVCGAVDASVAPIGDAGDGG
jgi:hypothetical protein